MPAGFEAWDQHGRQTVALTDRMGKFTHRLDTNGQHEGNWWFALPPGARLLWHVVYSGGQQQDVAARPPYVVQHGNDRLEWYYGDKVPAGNKYHIFYVGWY